MNEKILLTALIDIGLTEKEARVYFASLSLGPTTLLRIAGKAGINRTTCYPVVDSLKNKGLITSEIKGFKEYLVAENPEHVERLVEMKREKFGTLLPEFLSLYNQKGSESDLQHIIGMSGIKNMYEKLLKKIDKHEDYLVISNEEEWLKWDEAFFTKFQERRAKRSIPVKMLLQDTPLAKERKKFERNLCATIKLLPKKIILQTNVVITPYQMIIHQLTSPVSALVIKNQGTIQTMQQYFEMLWQVY